MKHASKKSRQSTSTHHTGILWDGPKTLPSFIELLSWDHKVTSEKFTSAPSTGALVVFITYKQKNGSLLKNKKPCDDEGLDLLLSQETFV